MNRSTVTWTSAAGDVLTFDCPTGLDLGRRSGFDLPGFDFVEDDVVDSDGTIVRGVRATPRTMSFPLIVQADAWADWRALHQRLLVALMPELPDGRPAYGTLKVTQEDGTSRQIHALYAGGAEGLDEVEVAGKRWRVYPLKLRATDPFWESTDDVVLAWGNAAAPGFFPILPVTLAGTQLLGTTAALNAGHVPVFGVWTITGPANGTATLRSVDLDRTVTLNLTGAHALSSAQSVVVDMRKGRQSITGPGGVSWWSARVGSPQFWPLGRGSNNVELTVGGAGPATTVTFAYRPRWLTE